MWKCILPLLLAASIGYADKKVVPGRKTPLFEQIKICNKDLDESAHLGIAPGYRFDKDMHFGTLNGNYSLIRDTFLFNAESSYGMRLGKSGPFDNVFSGYGDFGFRYGLFQDRLFLAPIVGYGFDAAWADSKNEKRQYSGPYAGLNFAFNPINKLHLGLGYSYHFLHFSKKHVEEIPDMRISEKISSWKGRGNRVKGDIFYGINENLQVGISSSYLHYDHNGLAKRQKRYTPNGAQPIKEKDHVISGNNALSSFSAAIEARLSF